MNEITPKRAPGIILLGEGLRISYFKIHRQETVFFPALRGKVLMQLNGAISIHDGRLLYNKTTRSVFFKFPQLEIEEPTRFGFNQVTKRIPIVSADLVTVNQRISEVMVQAFYRGVDEWFEDAPSRFDSLSNPPIQSAA